MTAVAGLAFGAPAAVAEECLVDAAFALEAPTCLDGGAGAGNCLPFVGGSSSHITTCVGFSGTATRVGNVCHVEGTVTVYAYAISAATTYSYSMTAGDGSKSVTSKNADGTPYSDSLGATAEGSLSLSGWIGSDGPVADWDSRSATIQCA